MDPRSITPEEYLQHAGFLSRLARGLVADRQAAEELVQDAWVTALERPPRMRGALRSWLATVVHNLARNEQRGSARRNERELRAARPEQGKKLFQARERLVALRAGARVVGAEKHVVVHREKGKEPPALEHMRDSQARAPVGRQAIDALPLEGDRARARPQEPRDRIHQRRLAGAVRSQEAHQLAGRDLEVDPLEPVPVAVAHADAARDQRGTPCARGHGRVSHAASASAGRAGRTVRPRAT